MTSNLASITRFVSEAADRPLPAAISDLAKQCLVDWFAVSLAALPDEAPTLARKQAQRCATNGRAMTLYGDFGAASTVALVNGTLSHSLDFDDMHFATACHASGPTLAAALAVAMDRGSAGLEVLRAFVAGYEVGATMGAGGIGPRLAAAGWHPTGVLGHFSSACASAVLLQLSAGEIANALGLAATQAGGLQASGGTMAKPFHVGKAAMNGVLAAELAGLGLTSNTGLIDDAEDGLLGRLLQGPVLPRFDDLGCIWQIEGNTFKPYAACQLTHAPYEAARSMATEFRKSGLREIRIIVNPLARKVAGREQASVPLEGKFCIGYCVALGLLDYEADLTGFTESRIQDTRLKELTSLARVETRDSVERWSATVELVYSDGSVRRGECQAVRGSPARPLSWSDLNQKFLNAAAPALQHRATDLLDVLHAFDEPGSMVELQHIIGASDCQG
ncbi:MmgE/PrpD family protein [Cupriavidus taiwanensis]|uniref:MmgE/PrpD family protein n=1 Tax=Cupriavidus taiwanensis TaxID=164546 RepID=UPI000E1764CD|nr:MmgE/PrpD family protein [Cupriavidus taiwanensis]SPA46647.1 conserved hypothetical protein [Cupriavidus taiwanensis]